MVAPALATVVQSIATTIADYRQHEITPPSVGVLHVEKWADQFDPAMHQALLTELALVLKQTYLSKAEVVKILGGIAVKYPAAYWRNANFIRQQGGGSSLADLLVLFDGCLQTAHGFGLAACGSLGGPHVYLDEVLFSGNRVLSDLRSFANAASTPATVQLHVITIAFCSYGKWYANKEALAAFAAAGKAATIAWDGIELEDGKGAQDADLLRPSRLPGTADVGQYVASLAPHAPVLRTGQSLGKHSIFNTPQGRDALEQVFLQKGVEIRALCPNLPYTHRPLGYTKLKTLGFGSTIVTYRNCPNSCPLAFWVAWPWYPLFPRKNN